MKAKFYIMPDSVTVNQPDYLEVLSQIIAQSYRNKQRMFIYCLNQAQAEALDEMLWQFDPEQFIPHNLHGEGPPAGAPVELGWEAPKRSAALMMNLHPQVPAFAKQFPSIIDFVPAESAAKDQARERYRVYRQLGAQLSTEPYAKPELNIES